MFRELLSLELHFQNIKLLRYRYDTIWGGASLLTMLLHAMSELVKSSWDWDFIINLSESDFPIKWVVLIFNIHMQIIIYRDEVYLFIFKINYSYNRVFNITFFLHLRCFSYLYLHLLSVYRNRCLKIRIFAWYFHLYF